MIFKYLKFLTSHKFSLIGSLLVSILFSTFFIGVNVLKMTYAAFSFECFTFIVFIKVNIWSLQKNWKILKGIREYYTSK